MSAGGSSAAGPSLPEGWDPGRDLAVLVGSGAAESAARFARAGQARLILVAPRGAPEILPPQVRVATSAGELHQAILDLEGPSPQRVVVQRTPDPWASAERQREVAGRVQAALGSQRLQARTVARFGRTWLLQGLENLDAIALRPSIEGLKGAFQGCPCVIVSPGPSLARNVHELRRISACALVIAGTHALRALQSAGVDPHFLVLADPGDLARHVAGLDLTRVEALVVGSSCRRTSFDLLARRCFTFASNGSLDDWMFGWLGEEARLASGGSVACSQASLAIHLGCDPITLVGQDLSFPEGRFYAPGTLDEDAEVVRVGEKGFFLKKPAAARGPGVPLPEGGLRFTVDQELVWVDGVHGRKVPTSRSFQAFLAWFEAWADSHAERVKLLNCTEGGALIRGMEHVPLAEAAASWPDRPGEPIGPVLQRACESVDPRGRAQRLAQALAGVIQGLDRGLELARRCSRLAHAAGHDAHRLKELGRAESELSRALKPLRLLALYAQDEILAARESARRATSVGENLDAALSLYALVDRAGKDLREPMQDALWALESLSEQN